MRPAPLPIRVGGLLRCCIESYQRHAPSAAHTSEGDRIECDDCTAALIVVGGAWQWERVGGIG